MWIDVTLFQIESYNFDALLSAQVVNACNGEIWLEINDGGLIKHRSDDRLRQYKSFKKGFILLSACSSVSVFLRLLQIRAYYATHAYLNIYPKWPMWIPNEKLGLFKQLDREWITHDDTMIFNL